MRGFDSDIECKYCGEEISLYDNEYNRRHGNKKYHDECFYNNKLKRQALNYKTKTRLADKTIKMNAVMRMLYILQGNSGEITLDEAFQFGFDDACPYVETTLRKANITVFLVDDYAYRLRKIDSKRFIKIYRKNECKY